MFKKRDRVLVPIFNDAGEITGELEGIFEGHGPMPGQCSVLVSSGVPGSNERVWRVPLGKTDPKTGYSWRHLVLDDLKEAPPPPPQKPVPQA